MEQVRFDDAYNSVYSWTASECERMAEACRARIASETDAALERAGLFEGDPLYQPMNEEALVSRLRAARENTAAGRVSDAMAFAETVRAEFGL